MPEKNSKSINYGIQHDNDSDPDFESTPELQEVPKIDEPIEASCCGKTSFFLGQALRDAARNKCNYCLGFCSVMIVVLSILVINTMINQGPLIFVNIAQQYNGQVDAIISPAMNEDTGSLNSYSERGVFLNYT